MTSCATTTCGVGGWGGPLPGDPDNNSILTATPAFGGIDVSWTYPSTNPEAVAYVQLYRGLSATFANAILLATVGGNFFYDKSTSANLTTYYYWIKIVSVNGTVGELIGPASAVAKPTIASVIEGLTGQIDAGVLAQSLKAEIDKITLNGVDISTEIANRIAANNALSSALAQVQSGVDQTLTFINEEITSRQEGDSALITQLNTVAAANQSNLALIQQEQSARVTGDEANASLYTLLNSQVNNATTGLPATRASLLNDYYTRTSTDSAIASATSNLVSNTTLANYTTTAALQANYYTKTGTDGAISSAITTSQTTLNSNIASAQSTLQTNINTVDGKVTSIGARYTAVVSVNGLIGGFGIYNDGSTIQAGFDVDEFWIGKTQANKRKPFIISNGVTYIDDAAIEKLTFTKLRDTTGSLVFENGKLKADYISVTRITGGQYNSYNWPSSGGGFYLGPEGMLMGRYSPGGGSSFFQYDMATGALYMNGLSIVNGNANFYGNLSGASGTFSGSLTAQVINTDNIVGAAITSGYASSTGSTTTSVTINIPSGASSAVIVAYLGDAYQVIGGQGESSYTFVTVPEATLYIDGSPVATQRGTMIFSVNSPSAGTHSISLTRSQASGIMNMSVLVSKR